MLLCHGGVVRAVRCGSAAAAAERSVGRASINSPPALCPAAPASVPTGSAAPRRHKLQRSHFPGHHGTQMRPSTCEAHGTGPEREALGTAPRARPTRRDQPPTSRARQRVQNEVKYRALASRSGWKIFQPDGGDVSAERWNARGTMGIGGTEWLNNRFT